MHTRSALVKVYLEPKEVVPAVLLPRDLAKMENVPVTGLEDLEKHLHQLVDAPETPLKAKLFDEVELQLSGTSLHCSDINCC